MAKSGILFARLSDLRSEGNATTLNGSHIVITRYLQGWKIVVTTGDIVQQLAVTDSLMDIILGTTPGQWSGGGLYMKFNISKEWCERSAKLEDGCEISAGIPPQFRASMGWAETLLWKLRDAYWCRRKLCISWRFAWQHAESHVEQNWHLEMTPKQAAQEEAYAWADSC